MTQGIINTSGGVVDAVDKGKIQSNFTELYARDANLDKAMTVGTGFVGNGGFYTSMVYKLGNVIKTGVGGIQWH